MSLKLQGFSSLFTDNPLDYCNASVLLVQSSSCQNLDVWKVGIGGRVTLLTIFSGERQQFLNWVAVSCMINNQLKQILTYKILMNLQIGKLRRGKTQQRTFPQTGGQNSPLNRDMLETVQSWDRPAKRISRNTDNTGQLPQHLKKTLSTASSFRSHQLGGQFQPNPEEVRWNTQCKPSGFNSMHRYNIVSQGTDVQRQFLKENNQVVYWDQNFDAKKKSEIALNHLFSQAPLTYKEMLEAFRGDNDPKIESPEKPIVGHSGIVDQRSFSFQKKMKDAFQRVLERKYEGMETLKPGVDMLALSSRGCNEFLDSNSNEFIQPMTIKVVPKVSLTGLSTVNSADNTQEDNHAVTQNLEKVQPPTVDIRQKQRKPIPVNRNFVVVDSTVNMFTPMKTQNFNFQDPALSHRQVPKKDLLEEPVASLSEEKGQRIRKEASQPFTRVRRPKLPAATEVASPARSDFSQNKAEEERIKFDYDSKDQYRLFLQKYSYADSKNPKLRKVLKNRQVSKNKTPKRDFIMTQKENLLRRLNWEQSSPSKTLKSGAAPQQNEAFGFRQLTIEEKRQLHRNLSEHKPDPRLVDSTLAITHYKPRKGKHELVTLKSKGHQIEEIRMYAGESAPEIRHFANPTIVNELSKLDFVIEKAPRQQRASSMTQGKRSQDSQHGLLKVRMHVTDKREHQRVGNQKTGQRNIYYFQNERQLIP